MRREYPLSEEKAFIDVMKPNPVSVVTQTFQAIIIYQCRSRLRAQDNAENDVKLHLGLCVMSKCNGKKLAN